MAMFGAFPKYYVARPDGTLSALVEVDQLPTWIQIAGISTNLPAIDAKDMACVGNSERAPLQYIIIVSDAGKKKEQQQQQPSPSPSPPSPPKQQQQQLLVEVAGNSEDNREPRNGLGKNNKAQNIEVYRSKAAPIHSRALAPLLAPALVASASLVAPTPAPAPTVIEIQGPDPAQASAPDSDSAPVSVSGPPATAATATAATATAPPTNPVPQAPVASSSSPSSSSSSSSPPAPLKNKIRPRIMGPQGTKRFCTYWIRTGGCNFMQQGCIYSHVMPDEETLKDIGFPDGYPKWYRNAMRRANKGSPRLTAKQKGRINKSQAAREDEKVLPVRSKTDRNPAPLRRRIEPVVPTTTTTTTTITTTITPTTTPTITTTQIPIAESTSSSSPEILDLFSTPLLPLSWQSSNDMPALRPVKIVSGVPMKKSQAVSKYVQIRLPDPKHCYLFEGKSG